MSVLIVGHVHTDELAFRTGRLYGPNVQTLDVEEVEGNSNAAADARTRHTVLDLNNTSQLNAQISRHRNSFAMVIIDFAVWKFITQRATMVGLVDLLVPGGKLQILDPEEVRGGLISIPRDIPYEQVRAQNQMRIAQQYQETLEIFQALPDRVYVKPFRDVIANDSEDSNLQTFLVNSQARTFLFETNPKVLVVQRN